MIPLILASKSDATIKTYLASYISQNNFSKNNIYEISPVKNEIVISQIKELRKHLRISASLPRLFVIYNFDNSTIESQNALLKSLEESTDSNQFVLIVSNIFHLLGTIRSRARVINLDKKVQQTNEQTELKQLIDKLHTANNYQFLQEATLNSNSREQLETFFLDSMQYFRVRLSKFQNGTKILNKIIHLNQLVKKNNLNPQLAFDNLLIFIFKMVRMKEQ